MFNIMRAPMEIAVGIAFGILSGLLLWFIPPISDVGNCRFILSFLLLNHHLGTLDN